MDDTGGSTTELTQVMAAPNPVCVTHFAAREILENHITEKGALEAEWDSLLYSEDIEFYGCDAHISGLKEIPKEHYDVMKLYLSCSVYSYEDFAKLGNYSKLFSREQMEDETLTEDAFYTQQLSKLLAEHQTAQMQSISVKPMFEGATTVRFVVKFAMTSGAKLTAVVSIEPSSEEAKSYMIEKGYVSDHSLKSSLKIGTAPDSGVNEAQVEMDKTNVQTLLKNFGSESFSKYACFAIHAMIKNT
ncbi:hypothetical protein [Vibrio crassostreae]|uniref:hypothetical protein n=1 Tax=Vibrio crassostreae TaxID=246167 RepID=UPI001B301F80|nr:hypothetical protein [Vibrio crassostreae]